MGWGSPHAAAHGTEGPRSPDTDWSARPVPVGTNLGVTLMRGGFLILSVAEGRRVACFAAAPGVWLSSDSRVNKAPPVSASCDPETATRSARIPRRRPEKSSMSKMLTEQVGTWQATRAFVSCAGKIAGRGWPEIREAEDSCH